MTSHGSDNEIEIVLPIRTDLVATLRVMAASLGADVGLSVDEIDDLRLALSEVFSSAAESERGGRMSVTFCPEPHAVDVAVRIVGPDTIELDELAATILRSVVDDFRSSEGTVHFVKRSAEAVA